jgi:pilus assembly protein FimV
MRAITIVTFGLLAGAIALPGPVLALGLGKLTVDSALGQPLSARIELTSATREELDTLTARVADPTLYRENNLTYQAALARTRITVDNSGPTPVLKVTSPVSVQEPFLDLMIEMNWASGRVVREYTFLLDPPGTGATMVAEPTTPARAGTAAAPPARTRPATQAQAPEAAPSDSGNQYTVKRGDTLSKIANQYKPEGVTLDQMLVALFSSNENAFDGRNMNRLRTGSIITVPNAADLSATPAADATKTVRVQASDWRSYRDRVAGNAPEVATGGTRESSGAIGTSVGDTTPAAPPGRDQLRVSREARTGGGGGREDAVARDKALQEANARIAELEKMVRDMQATLAVKSGSMASLQADAAKAKGADASKGPTTSGVVTPIGKAPETTPPTTAKGPEPAKAADATKAADTKAAAPATTPATTAPTTTASTTPPATTPTTPATTTPPAPTATDTKADAPKSDTPPPPVAETKAPTPKAAPKAPPKAAPKQAGFFEDLISNPPYWAIGIGALVLIAGVVLLLATRRRKTTKFEDSIISGTDIKTNTVFGSTGGGVVNTGDNSLASDFSREGLGNIDTDEVDPIAEAEVYLAYGRDAQAEEILKDALKKDPQRQEIYLKLLEIHAQHNKPSAFETVASELYAVSQGQGEVWKKAVALGRTLDPNNPLFSEGGAPMPPPEPHALADAPMLDVEPRRPVEPRALDNMIDDEISISPTSGATAKTPQDILAGAEEAVAKSATSASSTFAERAKVSAAESAGAATAALAGALAATKSAFDAPKPIEKIEPKYDLDFHLDDADKPAPLKPKVEPRLEPALATAAPTSSPSGAAPSTLARPAAALELDKLDLSFDPERTTYEDPTPSVLDGQWHDAATKLDLAKAYQEMGDVEGAREILQEVLHEGDDQQKAEAQGLLAKLG